MVPIVVSFVNFFVLNIPIGHLGLSRRSLFSLFSLILCGLGEGMTTRDVYVVGYYILRDGV